MAPHAGLEPATLWLTASARSYLAFGYNLAALKGEKEQRDRVMAMAKGKRIAEHWVTNCEASLWLVPVIYKKRGAHPTCRDGAQGEGVRETAATYQAVRAASALVALCESYWYPLYAYLRRSVIRLTRPRTSCKHSSCACWKSDISIAQTGTRAGPVLSLEFVEILRGRRRGSPSRTQTRRRLARAARIRIRRRTLPARARAR